MSRPAGQPGSAASAAAGQRAGSPGLLEKLAAAVRPEFRADVLVFDPADPVFGGDPCVVDGCARTARARGMCGGHHQRWVAAGRPDPGQFPVTITAPWLGCGPLASGRCRVAGCGFGLLGPCLLQIVEQEFCPLVALPEPAGEH